MQLSVIIVNYNVKYFLEQCLYSARKATKDISAEIIVVDNNSTDSSRDYLTSVFPEVVFIWNRENVGFARANNLAMKRSTGKYILFLNPDTILAEDTLTKCIHCMEQNPAIGALGVRMVDGSGMYLKESKRSYPSPMTSLYKLLGLAKLFPHSCVFAKYHLGNLNEYENNEVDVLAGAFMMAPREVLNRIDGFDESFFMYGEDIDISYRIQQAGCINYYFSETTIIHFKGESTQKGSLKYVKLFYTAMSQFVQKHFSGGKVLFFRLFMHVGIWLRAIVSGVAGFVRKLIPAGKTIPFSGSVVIVSGEDSYVKISSAIKQALPKSVIIGRVDSGTESVGDSITDIAGLPEYIKHHSDIGGIVFCIEELSYKTMIGLLVQLPHQLRYWFHTVGSGAIIGSNDKDCSGEFWIVS